MRSRSVRELLQVVVLCCGGEVSRLPCLVFLLHPLRQHLQVALQPLAVWGGQARLVLGRKRVIWRRLLLR